MTRVVVLGMDGIADGDPEIGYLIVGDFGVANLYYDLQLAMDNAEYLHEVEDDYVPVWVIAIGAGHLGDQWIVGMYPKGHGNPSVWVSATDEDGAPLKGFPEPSFQWGRNEPAAS
jgi:hypothetical protein